jgi:hypothetical protein
MESQKDYVHIKAKEKIVKAGQPGHKYDYPIYDDDVLVKSREGGYTKLTGICVCNLPITDDEVEQFDRVVYLSMM